ncbi:hypothetical protein EJ08DRAFT_588353 [Tothia fuscella]|uniref:J domain-containing protein n=1 Tax=Tothia fuscella TaxID=1048955 RepID=A0A9P4NT55_9PEZI|nr:hypothetical protein EJ08DRAFT_588353 [Tothia fuscella]
MSTDYNYDEQGQFFPYFILTITAILTVPTTYSWLRSSSDLESTAPRIKTDYQAEDGEIIDSLKAKQKRKERKIKRMTFSLAGWAMMAFMVYLILVTARTVEKRWDPYDVLGISRSATEKEIKSFYRKLSLTKHPDKIKLDEAKNQTVDWANEQWVDLTKAFKALTDEEIRRNFLEYGHPDGKQSFSIGIALPQFLVAKGSGKFVLAFYGLLIGVLLPYFVGTWWYGSQKRTKEGILVASAGTIFQAFKEDIDAGGIVEAVSGADEYKELLVGDKAESGLAKIEQKVLAPGEHAPFAAGLSAKDRQALVDIDDAQRRKTLALIWAYLGRVDLADATLNDEKYEAGAIAFLLNEAFAVMALHFSVIAPVMSSYHLSQCIIQATPPNSSPLLQLPHFNPKIVEAIEGPSARVHFSVQQFMDLPAQERKRKITGPGLLSDVQYQQAVTIAQQLPYLKVEKAFFKVQGEKFVTPNSLVQFVVKARIIPPGSINVPAITEKDLEDVDKVEKRSDAAQEDSRIAPPLAHAPYFARDHSPRWHVFLGDSKQGKIAVPPFTFATFDEPLFTEDGQPTYNMQTLRMQFGAPPQAGRYTFVMNLVCDSYIGLDTKLNVTMEVEDESRAEQISEEAEISEPGEDSIAGQMKILKGEKVGKKSKVEEDSDEDSSGSNTEGDEEDDDTSETDTDTDTDGE